MVVHHPKNIYKESERRRSSSSSCQHPKLTTNSTVAMSDWMMNGETDSYGVTDWWFICFFLSHRVSLPLPHKYTSIPFTSQWLSLWLRWLLFVCIMCVVCVLCLLSVSSFTTKRHHKRCYYFSYFTRNKACVNRREREVPFLLCLLVSAWMYVIELMCLFGVSDDDDADDADDVTESGKNKKQSACKSRRERQAWSWLHISSKEEN